MGTENKFVTGLRLPNSLSNGDKDLFIPNSDTNLISWYACGPTVYDSAHLGHARNYISGDIVRRVMTAYFGYNVKMCMNVTDIDDKIIARAHDQNISVEELARHHETQFWEDMQLMNCLMPNSITRVTEHMAEIIAYIQGIIDNGYAYVAEGSVYFDIEAFCKDGHTYSKMDDSRAFDPKAINATAPLKSGKKLEQDFALWKAAKPDEPNWSSPWGSGRPGWHIECSAMACTIFGAKLDIHSGGIDLKFPHHTNELAQSEARYNQQDWVNYFIHAGHLHIQGCKMSKSLKNFVTIKECLELHPARVWRILFCLNKWSQAMEFSCEEKAMHEALSIDKKFHNLFSNVAVVMRDEVESIKKNQKWTPEDDSFDKAIDKAQNNVHGCLCDGVETVGAILELQNLASATSTYINSKNPIKHGLVRRSAEYIHRILSCLGICVSSSGFGYDSPEVNVSSDASDGIMNCFTSFRAGVRTNAIKQLKTKEIADTKQISKDMLKVCDDFRDSQLPQLGYRIEDGPQGSVWKKI